MGKGGRLQGSKGKLDRTELCKNQTDARTQQTKYKILHRNDNWPQYN